MSGFEIAGTVLGAIPLVIAAVEHYEDVTDPMKVFIRFNGEVSRVIRELGNLRTSYELSLKVVLQPFVNDQELVDMMEDPESELWGDHDIDDLLRNSLGDAYSAYMRTTEDIKGAITEILNSLNIQDFNKASGDEMQEALARFTKEGRASKFQIKDRFKYSKNRKRIKTLLGDIRNHITLLDSYEAKATKIATQTPAATPGRFKFALPLNALQTNAAKLYDVLSKSWCSNHSSHSAGLLLEQRIITRKRGRQRQPDSGDTSRFEISFLQAPRPQKQWLGVEFRLVEHFSKTASKKRTQVQILITTTEPKETPRAPPPYENPTQLQIVNDLCRALQSHSYPFVGFCFDNVGCLRGAYEAQQSKPIIYHHDGLSLQDLIQQSQYQLSMRDKYMLSITLASALLQLSPTPWLYGTWKKSNIIFLRTNNNQLSGIPVDISHPYLIHEHTPSDVVEVRQQSLPENDSSKLLSLGVMLVEILNGQSIESIHQLDDLGPNHESNQFTNFIAIRRWLEAQGSSGNISVSYYNAIQYCLECFAKPNARLTDQDFAKTVIDKVLAPLVLEINWMFGERPGLSKA